MDTWHYDNKIKIATPASFKVATNSDNGPNTEYIRFWKFNEYWIICFLKIDWIPNTNSSIQTQVFE